MQLAHAERASTADVSPDADRARAPFRSETHCLELWRPLQRLERASRPPTPARSATSAVNEPRASTALIEKANRG